MRSEEMHSIYVCSNDVNDKEYVGLSKDLPERKKGHKYDRGRGCVLIGRAIAKHGFEHFHFEEVFVAFTREDAGWAENKFITERQTLAPDGYNPTLGGDGVRGLKLTPEHKVAVSKAQKGRKHSAEETQRRAESLRAFYASLSPEERAAMTAKTAPGRAKAHGAVRSDEWRAKQSAAHKGKKRSAESVAKTATALRGKPRSPETWEKIRAGHKRYWEERKAGNIPTPPGKKPDEETRKKMSVAQKRRFAAMSPEEMDKAYESRRDGRMSVMAKAREERKRQAGYKVSDEARRKMSEAQLRRAARERAAKEAEANGLTQPPLPSM